MKRIGALALTLALIATACSKSETNTSNSVNRTVTTNTGATTSAPSSTEASTPSAAYKAAVEAARKKDAEGLKKLLSQASLKSLEEAGKREGKTSTEVLKAALDDPEDPPPATTEIRNEKIDGDRATLEYKNTKGQWESAYLVKEGGSWKLDLTAAREVEGDKNSSAEPDSEDDDGASTTGNTEDHGGH